MKEFLLNLLRIRRVEFRIAEIPILLIPILLERTLGAPSIAPYALWEGVLVFFFLFAFGDMINCLSDRDLDAVYKAHLSRAVYGLGVPFVWVQTVISAAAALGIAAHLAWRLDRWLLVPMVVIGLILGAAYSVPPVRLKSRGILQGLCLWLIIFFGPMLFAAMLTTGFPSSKLIALAAAYATIQMGVVLVNSAEDFPEDRAAGVRNTIVSLGLAHGAWLAANMAFVGGIGVLTILGDLYLHLLLPKGANPLWLAALLPAVAAIAFVAYDIHSLARLTTRAAAADEEVAIAVVKKTAKRVPIWITLVAWTTCAAVAALYWLLVHGHQVMA